MDMAYRVLWVEDNDNWLRSNQELVRQIIEDEYDFRMHLTKAQGSETMPVPELWRSFDIVLMDMNLMGIDGAELIDLLRKHEVYTDVVFYSQAGATAVRQRAQEMELDGIFCSSRDAAAFGEKVAAVISNTVRKVQDVNALRGLVTAEASDVDALLKEVMELHHAGLTAEDGAAFSKAFHAMLFEDIQDRVKSLTKLEASSLSDLLGSSHVNAFQLWRQVVRIAEKAIGLSGDHVTKIKEYQNDVQKPRNSLAHAIAVYDKVKGTTTLQNPKRPNDVQEFTDAWCRNMRRTLREHRAALSALRAIYRPVD